MGTQKTFTEKTNADNKEIGFQYQYYYFLYRLLNLKSGQSVGLEVRDDVHTDLNNDSQILFQLKHTVQKSASGAPIALTELDVDLWKTLSNWINIIIDPDDGRDNKISQISFVKKTEFHLISNKSENENNKFLSNLKDYKNSNINFQDMVLYIEGLYARTKDIIIKEYIKSLLSIEKNILKLFLDHIQFRLGIDDIIKLVKNAIREKMISEHNVESVYNRLDSTIRHDNFITIRQGEKIEIDFDSFYKRYRKIFSDSREPLQMDKRFHLDLPSDIFSQVFIKQLMHINALKTGDIEKAIDFTTSKLKIARYLDEWVQDGELISDEVESFHKDVIRKWINSYEHFCEDCDDNDLTVKAKALLHELRKIDFLIASNALNTELSNGELYYLSDDKRIGWHRDWKTLL